MAVGAVQAGVRLGVRDVPYWLHTLLPPIPLILEGLSMTRGLEFHDFYFKGEFGFWELGTAVAAFIAFAYGAFLVLKGGLQDKRARLLVGILAFGSFYLAGEEVSWGQHIGGWTAGGVWGDVNYQQETNLHNIKYLSITNQLPRLVVTLFAAFCLFAPIWKNRIKGWLQPLWPNWVCLTVSLLVLLPPVPRMLGGKSLPEPGETAEFYMAVLLAIYLGSMWRRRGEWGTWKSERVDELTS